MTQEERQLLLKDLCARLLYGVKVYGNFRYGSDEEIIEDARVTTLDLECLDWLMNGIEVKPYLRPMSSMTEEERMELSNYENTIQRADFFYSHHLDPRNLIEKGFALPAPDGMYDN